ncbi:MAG: hypothetical protein AAGN35_00320 [Bacteroidota bacterium]
MQRPIFYVLSLFVHAGFWLVILLVNYTTYTSGAPEELEQQYYRLFEDNRTQLVVAELVFPVAMLVCSILLIAIKFRPSPIRLPYLLMLFMGVEFWLWRWLFFPDRMSTYYALNDQRFFAVDHSEGHEFTLLGYGLFFLLMVGIREYTVPENLLDAALDRLKRRLRRGEPPELPGSQSSRESPAKGADKP